ncbi:MAG TPA: hypothetical protein VK988_09885 [Acidimicrobiales bacterium]|nr:hypothetical protein [Acidimicrobiales bacterium]
MTWPRLLVITVAIAVLPGFICWLVVLLMSDPAEGANIGGGLTVLGVIGASWILAALFLVGAAVSRWGRRG